MNYDDWKQRTPDTEADLPPPDESERCPECGANLSKDEECDSDCPEYQKREAEAARETDAEVRRDYRAGRRWL